jgi:hypothetical protein
VRVLECRVEWGIEGWLTEASGGLGDIGADDSTSSNESMESRLERKKEEPSDARPFPLFLSPRRAMARTHQTPHNNKCLG